MESWKSRTGYWMGWAIAGALAAGFCLLLGIRMFAHETFCLPDELCLREWVSAISGVLAVFAAFASLAYVAKQLEQASKHHRDAMRVQLQRSRAVARRAADAASRLHDRASAFVATWAQPIGRASFLERSGFALSQEIAGLIEIISDPVFSAFEEEVDFVAPLPVARMREAFQTQRNVLEGQLSSFNFREPAMRDHAHDALSQAYQCVQYASDLLRLSEEFLHGTEELVRT